MHTLNTFMQLSHFSTDFAGSDVSCDKIRKICTKFGNMILKISLNLLPPNVRF